MRWLVPGVIPLRTSTLVAGQSGLGKSTYLLALAAQVTRGDLDGGPSSAIIISYEDTPEEILRPRLEAAGADLDRVFEILITPEEGGAIILPRDLDRLESEVEATSARLLIVDPVLASIDVSLDAHKASVAGGHARAGEMAGDSEPLGRLAFPRRRRCPRRST